MYTMLNLMILILLISMMCHFNNLLKLMLIIELFMLLLFNYFCLYGMKLSYLLIMIVFLVIDGVVSMLMFIKMARYYGKDYNTSVNFVY